MKVSIFFCLLTFIFLTLSASTSSCSTSYSAQSQSGTDYKNMAYQDAINAGIPPDKFVKQIQVESGFNPSAVSSEGAIGISQIMPNTAKSWNVDPYDPVASLKAAAKAMAWYQNTYGDYAKALACYNAGCSTLLTAEKGCSYYYWCLPRETRTYIDIIMN